MDGNAKNQLLELLKNLGCSEDCADFQSESMFPYDFHQSTVVVSFPNGRTVLGSGRGARNSDADIAAAKDAIEQLSNNYPNLIVDWADINVQAQAGDALIKLGIYLSTSIKSASDKSLRLQSLESDSHLAKVFDCWKAQGAPDLAIWGANLSKKRKATLVEALLWKRFGNQVISSSAFEQLQTLIKMISTD
ncbi:MAG: hypothetical protein F6J95_020695 [Leptolyngbya sp. SIO1E4]|nr:hypothetical protein [Leptolyngbya sp. SIO1E4]